MTIYETIKAAVSVPQAAAYYGMKIQRNHMTRCCFHDDHHYRPSPGTRPGAGYTWPLQAMACVSQASPDLMSSMKLNDTYYYCFACLEHGDVIDLVAQLHRESHYAAVQRIAKDFGIGPNSPAPAAAKPYSPYRNSDESLCMSVLTDYEQLLKRWKQNYAPTTADAPLDDRFVEACQMLPIITAMTNILFLPDADLRARLVRKVMQDNTIKCKNLPSPIARGPAVCYTICRKHPIHLIQGGISMRSGIREGFFYRGLYFLLPENYQDSASFMAALRQAELPAAALAVVLKEDSEVESTSYELGVCIAPYFISDYLAEAEPVVIEDADDVYPVQVELLTQQEYNDRLRALVTGYCPGCRGFGGLTKNDSSLSGHFDEISLNGFCPYRWETRVAPRDFNVELDSFVHYWKRYGYSARNADDLLEEIKEDLKLTYSSGAIMAGKGQRTLVLYSEKSTLLHTALTDVLAHYVTAFADEHFAIRFNGRTEITAAAVDALLTPKKLSAARKEMKKYGAALAILEYRSDCAAKVAAFTAHLADSALAAVLLDEPGRCVLLLLNEGHALSRIRYNAPMLESCGAAVTVYDALRTVRYDVSFAMKATVLEAAPAEAPKVKKITRKQLKAEESRILKRDQVKSLFTYVDIRLTSEGCDHTLRFTDIWLKENLPEDQIAPALEEIQEMGGGCDCEVVMNCYQDYDLED